jgi:hypothetical protein
MQSIHIKFATEGDRVRGFYELAKQTGIGSLPGKVYQVPQDALRILDGLKIAYQRASDEEIKEAHDQVRNPSAFRHSLKHAGQIG